MQKTSNLIAVNERGLRIGESHPRAVLSDLEVDVVLELRDAGWSFGRLAEHMDVSKSCIARICWGQRRAQFAVAWTRVQPRPAVEPPTVLPIVDRVPMVMCADARHRGINIPTPVSQMCKLASVGKWVCTRCDDRAAKNSKRARTADSKG